MQVIEILLVCGVLFFMLTLIDVYLSKKIRAYYEKKSARLEEEEKELRSRLEKMSR